MIHRRRGRGRTTGLVALLVGGLLVPSLTTGVTAQGALDPDTAISRRQIRGIERRVLTDPEGAARAGAAARRGLIRDSGGVTLDPERLRLERRLERLDRLPEPSPSTISPPAGGELPFSARHQPFGLSGAGGPLATARRLLARAADGMAEGRPAQARSDIRAARAELDRLPSSLADQVAGVRRELEALAAGLGP